MSSHLPLSEVKSLAELYFKSGLFKDLKSPEAAAAIILYGQDLGFPPTVALKGINLVHGGTLTLGASLVAALITRPDASGRHPNDYRIRSHTEQECTIDFFHHGQRILTYTYTMDDARRAGLLNKATWQQHPRSLLYSRCITQGGAMAFPHLTTNIHPADDPDLPAQAPAAELLGADVEVAPSPPPSPVEPDEVSYLSTSQIIAGDYITAADGAPPVDFGDMSEPFAQWLRRPVNADYFWKTVRANHLGDSDIQKALGVLRVSNYPGTVEEAIIALEAYHPALRALADPRLSQQ